MLLIVTLASLVHLASGLGEGAILAAGDASLLEPAASAADGDPLPPEYGRRRNHPRRTAPASASGRGGAYQSPRPFPDSERLWLWLRPPHYEFGKGRARSRSICVICPWSGLIDIAPDTKRSGTWLLT